MGHSEPQLGERAGRRFGKRRKCVLWRHYSVNPERSPRTLAHFAAEIPADAGNPIPVSIPESAPQLLRGVTTALIGAKEQGNRPKIFVNHVGVIICLTAQGLGEAGVEFLGGSRGRLIATGALALAAIMGAALLASGGLGLAGFGKAGSPSLTVAVPTAAADTIYGAPGARGRPIVVIDAGHGGRDPGARSVSGEVVEKDLTLALARELRDQLVKRGRVRVALTRDDDRYLTLEDRAAVARRLDAAMFVSLHMDSAANPLARGASVYSLSDVASDAEAARFAAVQNAGFDASDADGSVASILSELAMRSQMSASADLASRLVRKAAGRVELRPEPHRFAAFHVLRRADTPAVLFEGGYLSNADDEVLLRTPEHRSEMALALAQAIEADVAARSHR